MKKQGFTLVEIIIVLVVVGILATIGIPVYNGVIESSQAKVCQTNEEALKTALDVYVMEKDTTPASLSELPWEYIQKGYAKVLQKNDAWKVKLAYAVVGWQNRGKAYADPFVNILAKGDIKLITCPADTTSPENGGVSYGLNKALEGINSTAYRNLGGGTLLIGDCESATFNSASDLALKHKQGILNAKNVAQVIDNDGSVITGTHGEISATQSCKRNCGNDKGCRKNCKVRTIEPDDADDPTLVSSSPNDHRAVNAFK